MNDLADLGIQRASELLRSRQISSVELVKATLKRIEQTEPQVHAYTERLDEQALQVARRADAEPWRGPLHGIPFAVKDTICTAGVATEANSGQLAGYVPTFDASVVRSLRNAGAVLALRARRTDY